jgi:hypothetical protein
MKSILYSFLLPFSLMAVLFSCGESGNESKCEVGDPVAIFKGDYPSVLNQNFSLTGSNSVETVEFENGIKLELSQSGCEQLTQEFRFTIPGDQSSLDDGMWVDFAIQLFNYMGGIDIAFADFSFWGEAIKQIKPQLNVGVPFELAPGRWIKIDKVKSSDYSILLVTLSQQES